MNCRVCRAPGIEVTLDLGAQPLCNRFQHGSDGTEHRFPFTLGQCQHCGMMQLIDVVPADELRPRFDWISYREAEGHLDDLVGQICRLPGIGHASAIGAVSTKDDTTLDRLRQLGFNQCWRLDPHEDLGVTGSGSGPETVQARLSHGANLQEKRADVLLVRHVLEHAHDPVAFVAGLFRLVNPGGFLVFEVPDCAPGLTRRDYTVPWEEHVLYFTPDLLRQALNCWGLEEQWFHVYPYSHENSIVAIVRRPVETGARSPDASIASAACGVGRPYASGFAEQREIVRRTLSGLRQQRGALAVFGAGHLSCSWINVMEVADLLQCVIDDDRNKAGLFMPGSRLPIVPSSRLDDGSIRACLLSLSQESEARVMAAKQEYLDRGGLFLSIFPGKPNSVASLISDATVDR
jgi:hypothetical protein